MSTSFNPGLSDVVKVQAQDVICLRSLATNTHIDVEQSSIEFVQQVRLGWGGRGGGGGREVG